MDQNPHSQKKLEERNQWLADQGKIAEQRKQKIQNKRWRIYTEIKSWLPIVISLAALVVSIIALIRTA